MGRAVGIEGQRGVAAGDAIVVYDFYSPRARSRTGPAILLGADELADEAS